MSALGHSCPECGGADHRPNEDCDRECRSCGAIFVIRTDRVPPYAEVIVSRRYLMPPQGLWTKSGEPVKLRSRPKLVRRTRT